MPEKLLTLEEASEVLGVPEGKLRAFVEKGELPAYKVGGQFLRFRKEQIEAIRSEILGKVTEAPPTVLPKHHKKPDKAYSQSAKDVFLDFFYFNDFYLIAAAIIAVLVWIIFKT